MSGSINTTRYGGPNSFSDAEVARAIFMRDHDHLIVPHRYDEVAKIARNAVLLRRQWDKVQ